MIKEAEYISHQEQDSGESWHRYLASLFEKLKVSSKKTKAAGVVDEEGEKNNI